MLMASMDDPNLEVNNKIFTAEFLSSVQASILKLRNVSAEVWVVAVTELQTLPHVSIDTTVVFPLNLGYCSTLRSSDSLPILTKDQHYVLRYIDTFSIVTARVIEGHSSYVLFSVLVEATVKLQLVPIQSVPCLENLVTNRAFEDLEHIVLAIFFLLQRG